LDGHERTAQVNFLAPFLLTRLLLPNLQQSPDGPDALNRSKQRHTTTTRVVFVSSAVHRFSYPGGVRFEERDFSETNRSAKTKTKTKKNHDPVKAYGESKLCLVLLARMLAVVFSTSSSAETNCAQTSKNAVHFHSLHPGAVRTKGSERARLQSGGWLGAVVHFLGKPFLKVRPFQLPKSIPPPRLRIGRTHTVLSLTLVTVQIDYPSLLSIHRPIHAQYTPNKWTDGFFYRYQSAQAGAATTVRCCQMSDYESFQKNGGYHVNCELRKPSAHALDVALGRKTVRHAIQETNPYVVGHDCFSAQLRSGKYGF
jgi:NAD(P)-dependent dehydrogenase (short-subunit alcohol dehydrogenase family)